MKDIIDTLKARRENIIKQAKEMTDERNKLRDRIEDINCEIKSANADIGKLNRAIEALDPPTERGLNFPNSVTATSGIADAIGSSILATPINRK